MKESEDSKNKKSRLQKAWENPLGKAVIISVSTLAIVGLAGYTFKTLAFTVNRYKDFKGALKR